MHAVARLPVARGISPSSDDVFGFSPSSSEKIRRAVGSADVVAMTHRLSRAESSDAILALYAEARALPSAEYAAFALHGPDAMSEHQLPSIVKAMHANSGSPHDALRSRGLYRRAADLRDPGAAFALGTMHLFGRTVSTGTTAGERRVVIPCNEIAAIRYLSIAASAGVVRAQTLLSDLHSAVLASPFMKVAAVERPAGPPVLIPIGFAGDEDHRRFESPEEFAAFARFVDDVLFGRKAAAS